MISVNSDFCEIGKRFFSVYNVIFFELTWNFMNSNLPSGLINVDLLQDVLFPKYDPLNFALENRQNFIYLFTSLHLFFAKMHRTATIHVLWGIISEVYPPGKTKLSDQAENWATSCSPIGWYFSHKKLIHFQLSFIKISLKLFTRYFFTNFYMVIHAVSRTLMFFSFKYHKISAVRTYNF